MSNFVLVCLVFVMGFGWGAAAMYIPTYKKMREIITFGLACLKVLKEVADEQAKVNEALNSVRGSCMGIINATNNVIDSVDSLIEEIGNEI